MICLYLPWPQENMQVSAHLLAQLSRVLCVAAYFLVTIIILVPNHDLLTED